jgi:hypothetical protein
VTPEEMVSEARRLHAESATTRTRALGKTSAGAPLVDLVDLVPGLCDELERCLGGMRQLLAQRARLAATVDELSRLADDDTVSDSFLRGWITGETR